MKINSYVNSYQIFITYTHVTCIEGNNLHNIIPKGQSSKTILTTLKGILNTVINIPETLILAISRLVLVLNFLFLISTKQTNELKNNETITINVYNTITNAFR